MVCSERNGKCRAVLPGKVAEGTRADLAVSGLRDVGIGSTRWHVFGDLVAWC